MFLDTYRLRPPLYSAPTFPYIILRAYPLSTLELVNQKIIRRYSNSYVTGVIPSCTSERQAAKLGKAITCPMKLCCVGSIRVIHFRSLDFRQCEERLEFQCKKNKSLDRITESKLTNPFDPDVDVVPHHRS